MTNDHNANKRQMINMLETEITNPLKEPRTYKEIFILL